MSSLLHTQPFATAGGMWEEKKMELLNHYYMEVHATILTYQSPTLGLFPRGRQNHARVRDNVICATALWHLSLAYRQVGDDRGRTYELEKSAVKCMRGLLFCFMRQADKVERFKHRQSWEDALHARFDYITGDHVMDCNNWGHLQIDCSSLFMLTVAQMTASGVQVIFTMDEVNFIQNLVYYVERAYRIPDYGMWEQGSRDNVGRRELHASSIGMAKAALEAMNGLNLFGEEGSFQSIIHVDPDAQYRNCIIFNTLLPKESSSKETDTSLLMITGYPAFSIDDSRLCKLTEEKVKSTLEGEHGFKRFPRDSYLTVKKGRRKFKEPIEDLTQYEGIECEWPLFFVIQYLTDMCRGDREEADKYWRKVENCLTEFEGYKVLPRLFYVPECELENAVGTWNVGSEGNGARIRGASVATLKDALYRMDALHEPRPFLWAQALFYTGKLLRDGLITVTDLDPLGMHLPHQSRQRGAAKHLGFKAPGHDAIIQVALIAETTRLQAILATHGIPTQTQKQVEPIKIRPPKDILMRVYSRLGENEKLGLTGRPQRPIGALATSRVYRIFGQTCVFYPTDSMVDFYTSFDVMMLLDVLKTTLQFLTLYWNMAGRPTLCLYLTETRLRGSNFSKFVDFLAQLKQGEVDGIKVRVDRLQSLIRTSCIERFESTKGEEVDKQMMYWLMSSLRSRSSAPKLSTSLSSGSATSIGSFLDLAIEPTGEGGGDMEEEEGEEEEPKFTASDLIEKSGSVLRNLLRHERSHLGKLLVLHELLKRGESCDYGETVEERVQVLYEEAGAKKHWMALRYAAALLKKVVDCLAPSMTAMLVRGKEVTIGVFGYPEHVISEPLSPKEIVNIIYAQCMHHDPIETVLQQEIIIYLADMCTSHPTVFHGMLRFRIGWIIQAMKNELHRSISTSLLQRLPPHQVKQLLICALQDYGERSPLSKRQLHGALNRVPPSFYEKVYSILKKSPGGIFVRGNTLPQLPTIYETSKNEMNFARLVEEFLSVITFPEYRQIIVEIIMVISTVLERNPEIELSGVLNLDELLQDSIELYHADKEREKESGEEEAMPETQPKILTEQTDESSATYACHRSQNFYGLFPDGQSGSFSYMAKAVVNRMLQQGLSYDTSQHCSIS